MIVAILVGGKATRMKNYTPKPKPLIKINKIEILKLILNIYQKNKLSTFYLLCRSDNINQFNQFKKKYKNINITILDTGLNSETGKRINFLKKIVKEEKFCLTYGDSLANFNLKKSLKMTKVVTMCIFKKKSSFGNIKIKKKQINEFSEKKKIDYINAGFYIINKEIFSYTNKNISFEKTIIPKLIKKKMVDFVYVNDWHPMDNKFDYLSIKEWVKNKKFLNG